jgi:hypothetical protein
LKYVVQIAASFGRVERRCARNAMGAAVMPSSKALREIFMVTPDQRR